MVILFCSFVTNKNIEPKKQSENISKDNKQNNKQTWIVTKKIVHYGYYQFRTEGSIQYLP